MLRTSGSVVIPIVTWAPDPPIHEITSLLVSPSGNDLVTAGYDGNLVLWTVDKELGFRPKWMVSGHRAPVRNLCWTGSYGGEKEFFFSHSEASELALWDWHNGKCLEFKLDTRHQHINIKSHQPAFLEYRLLFCCGRYPHIVVIHAMSLSVLFNLASHSQPDWISNFAVFTHPNKKHEIVLGLSFSNVAILWTLNGEETQVESGMYTADDDKPPKNSCPVPFCFQGEVKYEHESRMVDCPSTVIRVHCCPQCPRYVLLVTRSGWQLLDATTCSVILSEPNPDSDPLVGGEFVDAQLVAIYCRSGTALLYRLSSKLPPSAGPPSSSGLPTLVAILHTPPPTDSTAIDKAVPYEEGFCTFLLTGSPDHLSIPRLLCGTIDGRVLSWMLDPSIIDKSGATIEAPTFIIDLAAVWKLDPPPPLPIQSAIPDTSMSDCSSTSSASTNHVTACVQIFPQPVVSQPRSNSSVASVISPGQTDVPLPARLAFGLSTGPIVIVRLTDFLQTIYWQPEKQTQNLHDDQHSPQSRHTTNLNSLLQLSRYQLCGHEGPVTCLLHPASAEALATCHDTDVPSRNNFQADLLVSGGADFTVRLWDLDPWKEGHQKKDSTGSMGKGVKAPATCLAVFRLHASPCIGLVIGPPVNAVMNVCAGNNRLTNCICSIAADGSVSLINVQEQRRLLFTGPTHRLSSASTVVALGWRVPEDLLLIAHADGVVAVWDITAGCLDRLESDQAGKDIFEQAHYVIEVQTTHTASSSISASLALQACQPPHLGSHNPMMPSPTAIPFLGSVNHPASSAAVGSTAPTRVRRTAGGGGRSLRLSPIQLLTLGVSRNGTRDRHTLANSPAAFVFCWDTEGIMTDLMAMEEQQHGVDFDTLSSKPTIQSQQIHLIRLLASVLHPWSLDAKTDDAMQQCLERSRERHPRLQTSLCYGLFSKHGCLSLSMPGWTRSRLKQLPRTTVIQPSYIPLCALISTNMLLAQLTLAETLTSLPPTNLLCLYESGGHRVTDQSANQLGPLSDSQNEAGGQALRIHWLQLAAHLCGPLLHLMIKCQSAEVERVDLFCVSALELLSQKWQDHMLPIRYAARTLLLALLDHLGAQSRQRLCTQWSSLLPPAFSSNATTKRNSTTTSNNTTTANPSRNNSLTNGQPPRPTPPNTPSVQSIIRKQSYPSPALDPSQFQHATAFAERRSSLANGSVAVAGMSTPPTLSLANPTQHPVVQQQQPLPGLAHSVSLCSLDAVGAPLLPAVADSHWWLTLTGYRVSARAHARLQATAIVLLGAIGTRFGSSSIKPRHPAVVVRDLIDDSGPIYPSPTAVTNAAASSSTLTAERGGVSAAQRRHGLAAPSFAAPDCTNGVTNGVGGGDGGGGGGIPGSSSVKLATIEQFALNSPPLHSEETVPDGFGFDNYQLARSTSQCLTALLFNRVRLLDSDLPDEATHSTGDTSPTSAFSMAAANALVCLLTANVNSSLRRAAIDLLGRGFVVWEPYVDLVQILNALLSLTVETESLMANLNKWQSIPDRVDLARTARAALWAIAFARPKALTLALSLEVRRHGAQLNTAAAYQPTGPNSSTAGHHLVGQPSLSRGDLVTLQSVTRRDSLNQPPSGGPANPRMMVMLSGPATAAPIFAPPPTMGGNMAKSGSSMAATIGPWPPMYAAREEIVRLFEQLCVRRAADIVPVLPELVEVVLACLDRTRLKERGLEYVFPALRQFSAFSAHTRLQKACCGGVTGVLTFFDFKIGRYLVIPGHKGPVTAVRFQTDGRLIATYSLTENMLKIWQLHTAGLFGIGGQQVKSVSVHPVPPLMPPPPSATTSKQTRDKPVQQQPNATDRTHCVCADSLAVWLDWPEPKTVQLVTELGAKRRVNI